MLRLMQLHMEMDLMLKPYSVPNVRNSITLCFWNVALWCNFPAKPHFRSWKSARDNGCFAVFAGAFRSGVDARFKARLRTPLENFQDPTRRTKQRPCKESSCFVLTNTAVYIFSRGQDLTWQDVAPYTYARCARHSEYLDVWMASSCTGDRKGIQYSRENININATRSATESFKF